MKIALAQLNYHIGNFESNTKKIIDAIDYAKQKQADLIIFGELAVCGYPPLDFLEFTDFTEKCLIAIHKIARHCKGIAAIVGSPAFSPTLEGKTLYNAAFYLLDGKIEQVIHKALLPTYDVFDEYRYFEQGKEFNVINLKGKKIAVTVCEDLWNLESDPLYMYCPMDDLVKQNPEFIVNIAASPFNYKHVEERKRILARNVKKYHLPLFYVNNIGAQTDLIFDGGSLVMDKEGNVIDEMKFFEEEIKIFDAEFANGELQIAPETSGCPLPVLNNNSDSTKINTEDFEFAVSEEAISRIHNALLLGIRDYFGKMNFKTAVLGMSGGIDSAVVLALAVEALGKENVLPVMMPSQFSSDHSVSDSEKMIQTLGTSSHTIPIKEIFTQYESSLKSMFNGLPFNVAEENLQARIRGDLVMAVSNKFGNILLNTSNKSELAVGYGTLYGDMCGGISVIGDVYKMQVFALARYINRNGEIIPENIITKPPSAELRPNQKDSDSLPDYEILDEVLFNYIECRNSINDILKLGFEEELVRRILKLVNMNEYKRFQFAPVLRVSPHAFGLGRRMPLVAKYLL